MALWCSGFKSQTESNSAWFSGTPSLMRSTWSMWKIWLKSRERASFARYFRVLMRISLRSICAIQLEQRLSQSKLPSMWQFMECRGHTLLYVLKITCTCGSTRARRRGWQCLSPQDRWGTENWEERFAGSLRKSLMWTQFMTWTSSTTPKSVKMWFALLPSVSKCWSSVGRVEPWGGLPCLILLRSLNCFGNHCLCWLVSTATKRDLHWLTLQVYWTFYKSIRRVEVCFSLRKKSAGR